MWNRIRAFFCRRHRLPPPGELDGEDTDLATDAELVDEEEEPPPWAVELGEAIRSGEPLLDL